MIDAPADLLIERDVAMTTGDGVRLVATVYRDPAAGPRPALLARTPYGKDISPQIHIIDPIAAVRAGFVVITQDVRGRYASQGHWRPYERDAEDGAAAVAWAAALPYVDGRVGMYGASYQGAALLAAAAMRPPALKSIAPMMCWRDPAEGQSFRGGALELGKLLRWTMMNMANKLERRIDDPRTAARLVAEAAVDLQALDASLYSPLPLGQQPLLRKYDPDGEIFDYLRQADLGNYQSPDMIPAGRRHDVPALWIGGWFDAFLGNMIREFHADRALDLASELIVTPWSHANHTDKVGALGFGAQARNPGWDGETLNDTLLAWFADTLAGGGRTARPVRVFAMGANAWRDEAMFPAPTAAPAVYCLTEDGGLAADPGADGAHRFDYDPADPAPTIGGATLMGGHFAAGPRDQRSLSERNDVLLLQGPPLTAPLTIADWVSADLWVESSAPCTDFVVRLLDVAPDGAQIGVTDGIKRCRLAPGAGPQIITVDLWATHYTLAPGHRLGVQVTSSSFPRWDRNLNTGEPLMTAEAGVVAHQTLHVGTGAPSALRIGGAHSPPMKARNTATEAVGLS